MVTGTFATNRSCRPLDADDIEHRINEHTRAIMPVHIYGAPANLDKVLAIPRHFGEFL